MADVFDQVTTEMTQTVVPIIKQVGKQLEGLQNVVSLTPGEGEITEALGHQASEAERDAYRQGHQSGWFKGALMFGCAVLAGLAVMTIATSGESKNSLIEGR